MVTKKRPELNGKPPRTRSAPIEIAKRYCARGFSIVPIVCDGSKRPKVPWKELQSRPLSQAEIDSHYAPNAGDVGIGLVTGFGGLEVLDFDVDAEQHFARLRVLVERESPGLIDRLTLVKTPSDGRHLYYRCETVEPNQKLAGLATTDAGARKVLIETRGVGGYVIAVGSPPSVHLTGRRYQHIAGPATSDVATITVAERELLLTVARSFDQRVRQSVDIPKGVPLPDGQLRPGDDFNVRGAWDEILTNHGWTRSHVAEGLTYWRRPGKVDGWSATTGLRGDGQDSDLLYVFSANAEPFDSSRGYSKFAAYALLEHDGDFAAAARQLRRNGYGSDRIELRNSVGEQVEGKEVRVPVPANEMIDAVLDIFEGRIGRVDGSIFVDLPEDKNLRFIDSEHQLFGLIRGQAQLEWHHGPRLFTEKQFFELLRTALPAFEDAQATPHFPPLKNVYYRQRATTASRSDGSYLQKLVDKFCPATPVDRSLIEAAIVTPFWGGDPGQRPFFMITAAAGRGTGKSALAQTIGDLAGGTIAASANSDFEGVVTRLLSPNAKSKRILLIDNVKKTRFSDAELEAFCTCRTISGKKLYKGEGARQNLFTTFVTINGPMASSDIAKRSVILQLALPEYSPRWREDVNALITDHRDELFDDIRRFFESEKVTLEQHTRWSTWETEVLSRTVDPNLAMAAIARRQQLVDAEHEEAELFMAELDAIIISSYPRELSVFVPSKALPQVFLSALGQRCEVQAASRRVHQYVEEGRLPRLAVSPSHKRGRGFVWTAANASGKRPKCSGLPELRLLGLPH